MHYYSKHFLNMFRLLIVLFLLILIIGCNNNEVEISDQEIETLNINLSLTTSIKASEIFRKPLYVPLETNDTCLFSYIEQLTVSTNNLFILEGTPHRRVFIFNRDGSFESTFGFLGRGPGEFHGAKGLAVNDSQPEVSYLEVLGRPRLVTAKLDGTIIKARNPKSIKYAAGGFNILQDPKSGNFIFDATRIGDPDKADFSRTRLCIFDDSIDVLYPVIYCSLGFEGPAHRHYHQLYTFEEDVYFKPVDWDTIYRVVDTRVFPKYRLDFGSFNRPKRLNFSKNFNEWVTIKESKSNFVIAHTFWREMTQYYIGVFRVAKKGSYLYIMDKKNQSSITAIEYANDWIGELTYSSVMEFRPLATIGDIIVFAHEPANLIRNLKNLKEDLSQEQFSKFQKLNPGFVDIVSNLKESDNPVLGFYQLKEGIVLSD